MTDKVQKIREEVEKRYEYWKEKESNSHSIESEIRMSECQHLLLMLDSMQEEPVSEDICNQCEAHNDKDKCYELVFGHNCPIVTTSEDLEEASEEYTSKVLERTNVLIGNQPVGEEIEAAFRAGAEWADCHQAEKDLALSWEDIQKIIWHWENVAVNSHYFNKPLKEAFEEVLRRFNEERNKV